MYEARKIANFLLTEFDPSEFDVTNLKLNKVLYFVQGWAFARLGRPVIRNHFEAWTFGPVIRTVYESFKRHGDKPILSLAYSINYETGENEQVRFDDLDDETIKLVRQVANHYLAFSAGELVAMTHAKGSPWDLAKNSDSTRLMARIPEDTIQSHFLLEFGGQIRN